MLVRVGLESHPPRSLDRGTTDSCRDEVQGSTGRHLGEDTSGRQGVGSSGSHTRDYALGVG